MVQLGSSTQFDRLMELLPQRRLMGMFKVACANEPSTVL